MKPIFFLIVCTVLLRAEEAIPELPQPVAPVTAPKDGMRWKISIGRQGGMDAPELVVNGSLLRGVREESLSTSKGEIRRWHIIGTRVYTKLPGSEEVHELNLDDADHDAAKKFYVSGFPGIFQILPTDLQGVAYDKDSKRFLATYKKKAGEMARTGVGDEAMVFPAGPSVPIEATFDATTGLPLFARVGDKFYIYEIATTGAVEAVLPPEVRLQISNKLDRAAALQNAIRRQESVRR